MMSPAASYRGYRFPPEIISHAIWLYHRFCLSFRDAEDLLAQRGITVTYETIRHWCHTFGPDYARRLRRRRDRMGDRWQGGTAFGADQPVNFIRKPHPGGIVKLSARLAVSS